MNNGFLGYDMLMPIDVLTHVHLKVDEFKKMTFWANVGTAFNLMGEGWTLRCHRPNIWVANVGQLSFTANNPVEALQGLTVVVQSIAGKSDDKDNGDQG